MTNFNGFKGQAKKLEAMDIPRIAKTINVSEDDVHTVVEVETAGGGFDSDGRPRILFEPHKFYANLPTSKREATVEAGLAAPRWGAIPYGKFSAQYPRLAKAMAIDVEAALKSCSWGASQILGENHKMIGFDTVDAMVLAFMDDEDNHIEGMAAFIIAAGIDDDLRAHNWATFARVYNGPGYKKNKYDVKLATAYAKWSGIADYYGDESADVIPQNEPPTYDTIKNKQRALSKVEIENIQERFRDLGYFVVGKVDGAWGDNCVTATFKFQLVNGISADGVYGTETQRTLFADDAKRSPVSTIRASTTVEDLRAQGSTEIKVADAVNNTGKGTLAATVATGALAYAKEQGPTGTFSWINEVTSYLQAIPPWLFIVAAGILIWYILKTQADKAKIARVSDERMGVTAGRASAEMSGELDGDAS